jgi:hypothetical protein
MFEKKTTEAMILHFDDLFCIVPCKELLFVAMEIIKIMSGKHLASRPPCLPWRHKIFKNILK